MPEPDAVFEAATMTDEQIVSMILGETRPDEYKQYGPSVLAIWRTRLDAARDLAYKAGYEQAWNLKNIWQARYHAKYAALVTAVQWQINESGTDTRGLEDALADLDLT